MATSGDDIAVAPSMAVSGSGPEHPHPLQGVPPPPSAGVLHQPNPFFKPQNVGSVGIVGGVAQLAVLPGAMGQGASLVDNARRGPQPTICEHQLPKSKCKKCKAMARICKHGKKKELCRECDGSALCVHDLRKKVPVPPSRAHTFIALRPVQFAPVHSHNHLGRRGLTRSALLAGVSAVRWLRPVRSQQDSAGV